VPSLAPLCIVKIRLLRSIWIIPEAFLVSTANWVRQQGIDLQLNLVPEEDHFLFFSQPGQVWWHLENWWTNQAELQAGSRAGW
jgi:hypothetical protein